MTEAAKNQVMSENADQGWHFWIDRGGTFTDLVARDPGGRLFVRKLLSEDPSRPGDAALHGIRDCLGLETGAAIPAAMIAGVKMGTTVATNALLERKGARLLLAITEGLGDALRIGTQNRPRLFDRRIVLPEPLYEEVAEIPERLGADGEILRPLDEAAVRARLARAYDAGIRAIAIVLMHGYRVPVHEAAVARIASEIGFTQISVSHRVSPLMKLVGRGDTTVADAYLSPVLSRYVDNIAAALGEARLMFMQSNGGLIEGRLFEGKDSVLSGPAGGIVGAVETSVAAGFRRLITFDMGGTSTDVAHFDGESGEGYERGFDNEIAGIRLRTPMMRIETVAAGGGSICHFDGARLRVGPQSAGADPGPACYRRGGPLCLTDCNVLLGKIQADHFPRLFGPDRDAPLDTAVVKEKFVTLSRDIRAATGDDLTVEEIAEGFLYIAVDNMANAIKKISIQRGHDIGHHALCCFGGAGGQHACLVADALGLRQVVIHPLAGVLSALGMGLADLRAHEEQAIGAPLDAEGAARLREVAAALAAKVQARLRAQKVPAARIAVNARAMLRFEGSDTGLDVALGDIGEMTEAFLEAHRRRFGFAKSGRSLMIDQVAVEAVGREVEHDAIITSVEAPAASLSPLDPIDPAHRIYSGGGWREAPLYRRGDVRAGMVVTGPAVLAEETATTIVELGWTARGLASGHLLLEKGGGKGAVPSKERVEAAAMTPPASADPVMLEIFNNLFMSAAEQMGAVLANTALSVNIKERMDFSCAVFDSEGGLVANAPHIPVHLGSMGDAVRAVLDRHGARIRAGNVYASNDPYHGGTHLPDITVITPVFLSMLGGMREDSEEKTDSLEFFVAARGHHADVGGTTPGSIPPHSRRIDEEGILIDNMLVVDGGVFHETRLREVFAAGPYPARNPDQNIADLQAQIAANEKGVQELSRMVCRHGLATVHAYMGFVQQNAADSVRRVIAGMGGKGKKEGGFAAGSFVYEGDDGGDGRAVIRVAVSVDLEKGRARIDFSGSSRERDNNFNAPAAICRAAVLYVFRTLVDDDIPLNAGCLAPLDIIIPEDSILNPAPPAAIVAGNVETSQFIVDALYGAMSVMASSQGTMNSLTFGNETYQYYETLCGGAGAGPCFDGADAVHTHMTNSRLTDPEVLETRFPVTVEAFSIRRGSGGAGRFRGGAGVVRCLRFHQKMQAAIISSHRQKGPYGMAGGGDGMPGVNRIRRADGSEEILPGVAEITVLPGDVLVIETPGGGGYGSCG